MHDKIIAGPLGGDCDTAEARNAREAVCIHTDKIYDQCRDKDCLTDLRVYLTPQGQELVNRSINVKIRKAEIIWVYSDVVRSMYNL